MNFTMTHPVLRLPTAAEAAAMGENEWRKAMARREEIIRLEEENPLEHGWESPTWRLAYALLGLPFGDPEWGARVRKALGFKKPVPILFCLGGNRAGKSEMCAKIVTKTIIDNDSMLAWCFQQSERMSQKQQRLMHRMLPPPYRHLTIRGGVTYLAFKQQTGFPDGRFTLPNGSEVEHKYYSMNRDDALQSVDVNAFWADELIPPDWIDDLLMRIASVEGFGIVSFTPIRGYSPTVRMVTDGAETVLDGISYLLPSDGGEMDVPRALGFGSEKEMKSKHEEGNWSLPDEFELVGDKLITVQPACPSSRKFQRLPRVMRCRNESFAILYFWSSDNPYGNPKSVVEKIKGKKEFNYTRERFHGFAERTQGARFASFDRKIHVVSAASIPQDGTNYMLLDPHNKRNFFMIWWRVIKRNHYIFREWPGNYEIPGIGVPGPWALPDGHHLDGRPGPAQKPFNFGFERYKREIARLEGWKDFKEAEVSKREGKDFVPVREWRGEHGAEEKIFERIIDSRAASTPRTENDRPRTLLTDFEDWGIDFSLAPGKDIADGLPMIDDVLDWDATKPRDFFNQPHLFISDACENVIFALETWIGDLASGGDGQRGATKEPIDLILYALQHEVEDVEPERWETRGGGYY